MKRHPYFDLWAILAVVLIAVVGVSIYSGDIGLGGYNLKKAPFRENLLAEGSPEDDSDWMESYDITNDTDSAKIDETPQTFLIFGDSMTPNLARRLAVYAGHNGHTAVHSVNWDSSTSISWAESDKLEHFIDLYKPTFIIVSLGGNESCLLDPSGRAGVIKKLISKFNGLPFIWIGPPRFGKQDPYNEMLLNLLGPNHYFRSDGLELERGKDNIHPVQSGSDIWMDAVMKWIPQTAHPFRAEKPGPDAVRATLTFDSFAPSGLTYGEDRRQKANSTKTDSTNNPIAETPETPKNPETNSDTPEVPAPTPTPQPTQLPDSI